MEIGDYNPFIINFNDDSDENNLNDEELKIFSVQGFGDDNLNKNQENENSFSEKESSSAENISSLKENNYSEIEEDYSSKTEEGEKNNESDKNQKGLGPIKEAVYLIEVEKIKPNSQQPRKYFHSEALKELAESIREYGILQPIIVVKVEKENSFGMSVEYEIIAGERRWRAAQLIGLERIPAIVRSSMKEMQKLEAAIIENVQRQDLNPIETSRSFAKLADEFGLAQREIAKRIGISRESVSNSIRLLQLSSEAQRNLMEGKISESHARVILSISNSEKQRALLKEMLEKKLTVRESEILAKNFSENFKERKEENEKNNRYEDEAIESSIVSKLEEILGTKVNVKKKGERGKITINFFSDDELIEIMKKIIGEKSIE
jgi:ParB family chromosome partitioning protein